MVVVKIELWPHGDESKMRPLGEIVIANDGTGNAERGNYKAELSHAGIYYSRKGPWKTGSVTNHARNLSPYHLVARVFAACGIR